MSDRIEQRSQWPVRSHAKRLIEIGGVIEGTAASVPSIKVCTLDSGVTVSSSASYLIVDVGPYGELKSAVMAAEGLTVETISWSETDGTISWELSGALTNKLASFHVTLGAESDDP